ncbi:hypothetical protein TNCV_2361191 [Trichonephila clavipes]|nr:hypothetical protein TNCV_2361191 [Trichonephila clavipes]
MHVCIPLDHSGNPEVKVTDSWPACHEFELCTTEDPLYWGAMHLNLSRLKYPLIDVEARRGVGVTSSGIILVIVP